MTSTTPDRPVSEKWPAPPPRPALVWGEWVTHHDTAGAVGGMSITPDPSGLMVTMTFSAFEMQLDGDGPLVATISLAGHLPLTLPLGVPLAGFRVIAQGAVERSPATYVLVTLTVGGEVRAARWDPVPVRHDPDSDPAPLPTGESPFGGQLALSSDLNLGCISPTGRWSANRASTAATSPTRSRRRYKSTYDRRVDLHQPHLPGHLRPTRPISGL